MSDFDKLVKLCNKAKLEYIVEGYNQDKSKFILNITGTGICMEVYDSRIYFTYKYEYKANDSTYVEILPVVDGYIGLELNDDKALLSLIQKFVTLKNEKKLNRDTVRGLLMSKSVSQPQYQQQYQQQLPKQFSSEKAIEQPKTNHNLYEVVLDVCGTDYFIEYLTKYDLMTKQDIEEATDRLLAIKVSKDDYLMIKRLNSLFNKLRSDNPKRDLSSFCNLINAFLFKEIGDNDLSSKLFPYINKIHINNITTPGCHNIKNDLDFVTTEIRKLLNERSDNPFYDNLKNDISKLSQYLISKNLLNEKELQEQYLEDLPITNMNQPPQFLPQQQYQQQYQQQQFQQQQNKDTLFKQRIKDFANLDKEIPVAEVFDDIGINLKDGEKAIIKDCTIKKRDLIDRLITCDVNQIIHDTTKPSKSYTNNTKNLLREICKPTNMNSNNSKLQEVDNLIDKKVDEEYRNGDEEVAKLRHNLKYYIADFKIPLKYAYEANNVLHKKYNEEYDDLYSSCDDYRYYIEDERGVPCKYSLLSDIDKNKLNTANAVNEEFVNLANNSKLFTDNKYNKVQSIPYQEINNNNIPIITILEEIGLGEAELFKEEKDKLTPDEKAIFNSLYIDRRVLKDNLFNATPLTFLLSLSSNIQSYEQYYWKEDIRKTNPAFSKMIAKITEKLMNEIGNTDVMNNIDAFIATNKIGFDKKDIIDENLDKNQRRSTSDKKFSDTSLDQAKTMNKISFVEEQRRKQIQQQNNEKGGMGGRP